MMASTQQTPRGFPLAQKLLFAALFTWMVLFNIRPVENLDVWWHLAAGEYLWMHRHLPWVDPFSFTCYGHRWIDTYWIYQVLVYVAYRVAGPTGLIAMKALLVTAAFYLQEGMLRDKKIHWLWRVTGLIVIFWGSRLRSTGWGEEASLVTWVFLCLLFRHLERARTSRTRPAPLWLWPGLFAIWSNTHPGFVIGLVVSGLYAAGSFWDTRPYAWRWVIWFILCCAATVLTPYGLDLYRVLITAVRHAGPIQAWQFTPWAHMEIFWITLTCVWLSLAWRLLKRSDLSVSLVLVSMFLSWAAWHHRQNVPFFMAFCGPLLIAFWSGSSWADSILERVYRRVPRLTALAIGLVLIGLSVQAGSLMKGGVSSSVFPVAACDFIETKGIQGPFFNDYGFGGYWIWRFHKKPSAFIDGRYPTVEGYVELWDAVRRAQAGPPSGWNRFLESYGVRAAILPYPPQTPQSPSIFEAYFPRSRWALVYWDDLCLVFAKRAPVNQRVIQECEFKSFFPDVGLAKFSRQVREINLPSQRNLRGELSRNLRLHPDSWRTKQFLVTLH
jgi:hypothetical protein